MVADSLDKYNEGQSIDDSNKHLNQISCHSCQSKLDIDASKEGEIRSQGSSEGDIQANDTSLGHAASKMLAQKNTSLSNCEPL